MGGLSKRDFFSQMEGPAIASTNQHLGEEARHPHAKKTKKKKNRIRAEKKKKAVPRPRARYASTRKRKDAWIKQARRTHRSKAATTHANGGKGEGVGGV